MKNVIDICGNIYKDHLGVQIFAQCNGYLKKLWIQANDDDHDGNDIVHI